MPRRNQPLSVTVGPSCCHAPVLPLPSPARISLTVQFGSAGLISTVPPLLTMALSAPFGIVPPQSAALLYVPVPPVQNRSTAWVVAADRINKQITPRTWLALRSLRRRGEGFINIIY